MTDPTHEEFEQSVPTLTLEGRLRFDSGMTTIEIERCEPDLTPTLAQLTGIPLSENGRGLAGEPEIGHVLASHLVIPRDAEGDLAGDVYVKITVEA